jgi:bifunctional non-homologous end joining protein LigD
LKSLFPTPSAGVFVTDLFHDGATLWDWVQQHEWEGVVAKRMSSPYREGKHHRDWYKKKTSIQCEVDIVGLSMREGQLASLVMSLEGNFFGKVSLGLTVSLKRKILDYVSAHPYEAITRPFSTLPSDLRGDTLVWTAKPFPCQVTGLEITSAGLLRHSKIIQLPTM